MTALPDCVPVPRTALGPDRNVLEAADVPAFTTSTTLIVLESIRLDLGIGLPVHP